MAVARPSGLSVAKAAEAKAKSNMKAGGHRQVADKYEAAGGRGDAAAKRTATRYEEQRRIGPDIGAARTEASPSCKTYDRLATATP